MALEYAVHQLGGYRLLVRRCAVDRDEIARVWHEVGDDLENGRIASSEPEVAGVGVTLPRPEGIAYYAGMPSDMEADGGAAAESYELFEVAGGEFAMVTYTGATEHIAQVLEALREAAADAGQSLTGESIEVYRTNEDDELTADIGLRLTQP
ncbi:MAG: hypothetical protein QF664_10370 [Dehalococcoidia bacterium]|jgi:effector-binding domain-containing protein|nr:hypothetical protein [Dehalococcoidia bacterium]